MYFVYHYLDWILRRIPVVNSLGTGGRLFQIGRRTWKRIQRQEHGQKYKSSISGYTLHSVIWWDIDKKLCWASLPRPCLGPLYYFFNCNVIHPSIFHLSVPVYLCTFITILERLSPVILCDIESLLSSTPTPAFYSHPAALP